MKNFTEHQLWLAVAETFKTFLGNKKGKGQLRTKAFFICSLVGEVTKWKKFSPSNRNMSKVSGGEKGPYYQSVSAFAFSVKLDHLSLSLSVSVSVSVFLSLFLFLSLSLSL